MQSGPFGRHSAYLQACEESRRHSHSHSHSPSHSHSQRTCRRARRAAGLAPGSARMAAGSTARKTGSPCIDEAGARVDEPERPVDEPDEADEADVTVAHRCSAASASALFPTPRAPVMRTPSTLPDAAPAATARSAPRMLSSVRRSSGRRPPRRGGGDGRWVRGHSSGGPSQSEGKLRIASLTCGNKRG